jgi:NAD-dependent deacetylase
MDEESKQLRQLIERSHRVVIFTGAGISTESGIPDFRGPKGLWKTVSPIDFNWRRQCSGDKTMGDAEPNAGHMAVAKLVQMGKVSHVITQNVDGLHHKSGIPAEQVIELHGNSNYAKCLDCETRYELPDLKKEFLANGTIPMCSACGGLVKTATISFGQAMPQREVLLAEEATLTCDLFIAIGSLLVVYPAAGYPVTAKRNGAALVIINNEPTDIDPICDLVLHRQIGETLSAVVD